MPPSRLCGCCRFGQAPSRGRGATGETRQNGDIALRIEARARLNSFDFSPRLDDGEEFYGILFRADFYVAEAIDELLDEALLPYRTLLHASEEG